MVILGGIKGDEIIQEKPEIGEFNIFLVDVLANKESNKVIYKKAIANYRVFAACSKGEGSQIFMIGGQDPQTGLWTRDATYIENLA
jgi:hypothetical protein